MTGRQARLCADECPSGCILGCLSGYISNVCPDAFCSSVHRAPYVPPGVPQCGPSWDTSLASKEPVVARAFYERYIFPLLGKGQTVGVVPGVCVAVVQPED